MMTAALILSLIKPDANPTSKTELMSGQNSLF